MSSRPLSKKEFIEQLNKIDSVPCIVALSGFVDSTTMQETLDSGFDMTLEAPLSFDLMNMNILP